MRTRVPPSLRPSLALTAALALGATAGPALADEGDLDFLAALREHASLEATARTLAHRGPGDPRDHRVRDEVSILGRLWYTDDHVRLKASPRLEYDDDRLTGPPEPFLEDGKRRPIFTFEEAYATAILGPLELSAGKRIYSWGKANLFRPTNLLNSIDLEDPLLPRPIGVVAADGYLHLGEQAFLEAVLVPFFTPDRVPSPHSRWFPVGEPAASTIAPGLARDLPRRSPSDVEFGVRACATLGPLDLAASYFQGFDRFPRAFREGDTFPPEVRLRYPQLRAPGLAASMALGSYTIYAEGTYCFVDPAIDESSVAYVLGVERRFESVPLVGATTVVLEYAGISPTRAAREDTFRLATLRGLFGFDEALLALVTLEPRESLRVGLAAVASVEERSPEGYVEPRISYVGDNLEVTLGLDLLFGRRRSFLGRYEDDDSRLFVEVKLKL